MKLLLALSTLGILLHLGVAMADPDAAQTSEADKRGFTLFDPVPADMQRDMDTDRPDKTNTPHTIDAGHLQIETGLLDDALDSDGQVHSNTLGVGQLNFRFGVTSGLEINAIINPYEIERDKNDRTGKSAHVSGLGDFTVGGKLNFWGNDGGDRVWSTAFGIQPQIKLPTASSTLGNGYAEFLVGLPLSVTLPEGFQLNLQTTGVRQRNDANTSYVDSWQNSVSIDHDLFGKADGFMEYWSEITSGDHQATQQTADVGLTYPLSDNVVLDAAVYFGLNRASVATEYLVGFSVRR